LKVLTFIKFKDIFAGRLGFKVRRGGEASLICSEEVTFSYPRTILRQRVIMPQTQTFITAAFTFLAVHVWNTKFLLLITGMSRSRWSRGVTRGSAAASLLGLRVRIPLGA
jgi:hypothetical protein